MAYTQRIGSAQWSRIYDYLCGFSEIYVNNEAECRRFVEATFWMARSGSQWRLLPPEYGAWNTVFAVLPIGQRRGYGIKCCIIFSRMQTWSTS
jgi:transposase